MTVSIHDASIPVFVRGLRVLSALLHKGEAHFAEQGLDPAALVEARIAPDMLNLAGQVQRASDTAKLSASRLTGGTAPSFPDDETTLEALRERCERTIAYLTGVPAAAFAGAETREIPMFSGERRRVFRGDAYLLTFALPNFYFHVTTAYDLLRQSGVPVGKRDYLGPYEEASA